MKFLDQLHEFYIGTWPDVISVNEWPDLDANIHTLSVSFIEDVEEEQRRATASQRSSPSHLDDEDELDINNQSFGECQFIL